MATGFCYRVQKDVVCDIAKGPTGQEKLTCDSTRLCGLVADGCPIVHSILKLPFPRKRASGRQTPP